MKRPLATWVALVVIAAAAGVLWWLFRTPALSYPEARRITTGLHQPVWWDGRLFHG